VQPLGIQLEDIGPGHQHIDLVYVARPFIDGHLGLDQAGENSSQRALTVALLEEAGSRDLGWYGPEEWERMGVTGEVQGWARAALQVIRSQTR
jgi:hypothetical protein